jgi:hypothetical protein
MCSIIGAEGSVLIMAVSKLLNNHYYLQNKAKIPSPGNLNHLLAM